jgi:DMSO/TMAO reductase YedYZ molybdopterin-dependent catalytic subunit
LPFGKELKGKALTIYLLIEAQDGYQVLFTLPELDALFTDKVVLLADRRDGKPLSEKEGPLRVVVPDEKRQARWIRQVKSITVRHAIETRPVRNP